MKGPKYTREVLDALGPRGGHVVFTTKGRTEVRFERRTPAQTSHLDAMGDAYFQGRGFSVIQSKRTSCRGEWFPASEW